MKNWIWKFAAAIGMTCIIAVFILAGYMGINYLTGESYNDIEYAVILSLIAIYQNCKDYIDKIWN